tara:strand:- start:346 stop:579 length:234 start_codon:yes stop_codon:yes gene_type:complete
MTNKYPKYILAMLTEKGFDERYFHHCKSSSTYVEAYEKTEFEFYEYFEIQKYASYDSFRVSHNKRIKMKSSSMKVMI